jgi:DNA-binding transcriptional MerR regulator
MAQLLIGDLSERTGVTPPTIRYYESIGLLKPAARSQSGYRRYSEQDVEELRFIRKAQGLGFSLEEIGGILELSRQGRRPCGHVLTLAHQHLAAVDERIRRLNAFRRKLAADLTYWEKQTPATACNGLCKWITDASTNVRVDDEPLWPNRAKRGNNAKAGASPTGAR